MPSGRPDVTSTSVTTTASARPTRWPAIVPGYGEDEHVASGTQSGGPRGLDRHVTGKLGARGFQSRSPARPPVDPYRKRASVCG
jgi:hypothetical protein